MSVQSSTASSSDSHERLSRTEWCFSAWGPGCERFHDAVDDEVLEDELDGRNAYKGPQKDDAIMTTWHARESLAEALEFFVNFNIATEGFRPSTHFWLVMCLNNSTWSKTINDYLCSADQKGIFESLSR